MARTAGVEWPDKDKTSISTTLKFLITPVNDGLPRIVNNTGLAVWAGSTTVLERDQLAAQDRDTPDTNLTFTISSPHCGLVSLASRPAYPVTRFTQQQLAAGQVLFTHTGQSDLTALFPIQIKSPFCLSL